MIRRRIFALRRRKTAGFSGFSGHPMQGHIEGDFSPHQIITLLSLPASWVTCPGSGVPEAGCFAGNHHLAVADSL